MFLGVCLFEKMGSEPISELTSMNPNTTQGWWQSGVTPDNLSRK